MMKKILNALHLHVMHSGHYSLDLSTQIAWDDFPAFATKFLRRSGGSIVRKIDGPDLRIWNVKIGETELRLVFDDYPAMVSIESSDNIGDLTLKHLLEVLRTIGI